MNQWKLEFEKWWKHISVEIFHRSATNLNAGEFLEEVKRNKTVIITSYGTLQAYSSEFMNVDFQVAFLDEGHKIRNPDSNITLVSKQLRSPNRIILTGAPIQNNLSELWSLFDFIFPGKLGTLPIFQEQFGIFIFLS